MYPTALLTNDPSPPPKKKVRTVCLKWEASQEIIPATNGLKYELKKYI